MRACSVWNTLPTIRASSHEIWVQSLVIYPDITMWPTKLYRESTHQSKASAVWPSVSCLVGLIRWHASCWGLLRIRCCSLAWITSLRSHWLLWKTSILIGRRYELWYIESELNPSTFIKSKIVKVWIWGDCVKKLDQAMAYFLMTPIL